jgi:CRP-like cAMP-binding protein
MNELLRFIDGFQEMDAKTVEAIRRYFVKETFKKDQFLVEEGKICSKVYFVQSGLIRRFYMDNTTICSHTFPK